MDWGSLVGIIIALGGILAGQAIEGGHISSLVQPAAFIIVILGTLGAVLLQTKPATFIAGIKMAAEVFSPVRDDREELAKRIMIWSNVARKEGLLRLENNLLVEKDVFVKKGLRLMIDGIAPEKIREIVSIDIYFYENNMRSAARIWESAGGYAPTIGILGAVL